MLLFLIDTGPIDRTMALHGLDDSTISLSWPSPFFSKTAPKLLTDNRRYLRYHNLYSGRGHHYLHRQQIIGRSASSITNDSTVIITSPPRSNQMFADASNSNIINRTIITDHFLSLADSFNVHPQQHVDCPPTELVRPCKCIEHRNDLFFRTLLRCNGSDFKYERRFENILLRLSKRLGNRHSKYFDWLHLTNMDTVRKITKHFFAGIRFRHLIIEDAPHLKHLHPASFKLVTNSLRFFYAYNTGLEPYRTQPMKAPLGLMRNLTEVHIASRKNICPPKGE